MSPASNKQGAAQRVQQQRSVRDAPQRRLADAGGAAAGPQPYAAEGACMARKPNLNRVQHVVKPHNNMAFRSVVGTRKRARITTPALCSLAWRRHARRVVLHQPRAATTSDAAPKQQRESAPMSDTAHCSPGSGEAAVAEQAAGCRSDTCAVVRGPSAASNAQPSAGRHVTQRPAGGPIALAALRGGAGGEAHNDCQLARQFRVRNRRSVSDAGAARVRARHARARAARGALAMARRVSGSNVARGARCGAHGRASP